LISSESFTNSRLSVYKISPFMTLMSALVSAFILWYKMLNFAHSCSKNELRHFLWLNGNISATKFSSKLLSGSIFSKSWQIISIYRFSLTEAKMLLSPVLSSVRCTIKAVPLSYLAPSISPTLIKFLITVFT